MQYRVTNLHARAKRGFHAEDGGLVLLAPGETREDVAIPDSVVLLLEAGGDLQLEEMGEEEGATPLRRRGRPPKPKVVET